VFIGYTSLNGLLNKKYTRITGGWQMRSRIFVPYGIKKERYIGLIITLREDIEPDTS
jgi:hypothetical protein